MADTSHLERMGRELKCPICLSLFNSAVSLYCNHVFCNECILKCILKSMKMDATCPLCKIPYHRREIRGAPHMDSLVSIYKNMEDAYGVNVFVSQNNPSPSDKEKHVNKNESLLTESKKKYKDDTETFTSSGSDVETLHLAGDITPESTRSQFRLQSSHVSISLSQLQKKNP